jgi:hypothetical protein
MYSSPLGSLSTALISTPIPPHALALLRARHKRPRCYAAERG